MSQNNNLKYIFECFVRNIKISVTKDGIKEITFVRGINKEGFKLPEKYDGTYQIKFNIDNNQYEGEITTKKGDSKIKKLESKSIGETFYKTKHGTINLKNSILGTNTLIIEKISEKQLIAKTMASQFTIGLSMLIKSEANKKITCTASFSEKEFEVSISFKDMHDENDYKVIVFDYDENPELVEQYKKAIKNDKHFNNLNYSKAVKGFIE